METPHAPAQVRSLFQALLAEHRAELAWSPSAMLCRAQPEPGASMHQDAESANSSPLVMFTALGSPLNARCDSVFDPITDRMFTFTSPVRFKYSDGLLVLDLPDDARVSLSITNHFIRDVRGLEQYEKPLDKSSFPLPPSGWCSWYFYYQGFEGHDFNEREVIRNAEWIAKNLKQFGAEYVQIDDAWQGTGRGLGENRDWETIDKRFPHGMRWLSDQIHALGLRSGLWLAPHGQSNTEFVQKNRDAFMWRGDGSSAGEDAEAPDDLKKFSWEGRYIVDTSGPAGQAYMRRLFTRLAHEWDYDYFKIDGQPIVQKLYEQNRNSFANPRLTPAEAYRAGLRVIREAIGPHRFLLGCWGTPWWGAGIFNGSRTGGDSDARIGWEGMRPGLTCTWDNYWTHNIVWYADPDVLCVRDPLTLEQARVWASVMGLTGQSLLASDKMYELPDDRVELLRRVFPPSDARPIDLFPVKQPDVICMKVGDAAGQRSIVGVFNWTTSARTLSIDPASLGLETSSDRVADSYLVYDVWNKQLLGRLSDPLSVSLDPTSCRVFCIRSIERNRPTLIGTSRHITQGGVDVERFDVRGNRMTGRSRIVGGDPYEIRFFLEPVNTPFVLLNAEAAGADVSLRSEGPVGIMTLSTTENKTVEWSVLYAVPGESARPTVDAPEIKMTPSPESNSIRISWNRVSSAAGYRVFRDGSPIGATNDVVWTDCDVTLARPASYAVAYLNWQGDEVRRSAAVSAELPKPRDAYLSELTPIRCEQQWGSLGQDKSVRGKPLTIAGQTYARGLGTHARSLISYNLARGYARFTSLIGIDDEAMDGGATGAARFKVVVDGRPLYDSGTVKSGDPARAVDLDITGRRTLELLVEAVGATIDHCHADWADAFVLAAGD